MIKENKEKREKKTSAAAAAAAAANGGSGGAPAPANNGNPAPVKLEPPSDTPVKEEPLSNGDFSTPSCENTSPPMNGPSSGNGGASGAGNSNSNHPLMTNGPGNSASVSGSTTNVNTCSAIDSKASLCPTNNNNSNNGAASSTLVNTNGSLPPNPMDNFLNDPTQDIKPTVGDLGPDNGMCGQLLASMKMEDAGLGPTPDFGPCDPCQPNAMGMMGPMGTNPMGGNDVMQGMPPSGIPKQPSTMDAQYMQQQSQIFVFCTSLANKAAESVLQGQFPTIIGFHCSQPGTKKFLEKHPLKINQFTRQGPGHWLNNMTQMKNKAGPGPGGFMKGMGGPALGPGAGPGPGPGPGMGPNMGGPMMGGPGMGASNMGDFGMGPNTGWNSGGDPLNSMASMGPMMGVRMGCPGPQGMGPMGPNQGGMGSGSMMQCCPGGNHPHGHVPMGPGSGPMPGPGPNAPVPCSSAGPMGPCGSKGPNGGSMDGMPPQMMGGPMMTSVSAGSPMMSGPPGSSSHMMGNPGGRQGNMVPMMQPGGNMSMTTGIKIPDENLTPQQTQHREEQLAKIRKMQELLFPEQAGQNCGPGPMMGPGSSPCPPGQNPGQQGMMGMHGPGQNQPGMMMMPGMMGPCPGPQGGPQGPGGPMMMSGGPGGPMMGPKQMMMGPGGPMMGGPGMMRASGPGPGPGHNPAMGMQMDWPKTEPQYMEQPAAKRKKSDQGGPNMGMGMSPMGMGMHGQMGPMQGHMMGGPMNPNMGPMGAPQGMGNMSMGPMGPMMNSGPGSGPSPGPGGPRMPQGGPGIRMQGPPPPYHQTQRSSSVPGNMTSPGTGPGSPSSTTGLSLSSPRAASGLSSPADASRSYNQRITNNGPTGPGSTAGPSPSNLLNTPMDSPNPNANNAPRSVNPSNPGTPLAGPGPPHVSPNLSSQNMNNMGSLLQSGSSQSEGVFGRTLQTFAQQKQQGKNEPNLMPVPSPQQIQYLNAFEAQELTIQKQPNTSLRETDILSPSLPSASLDSGLPASSSDSQGTQGPRMSGSSTPLTPSMPDTNLPPRYPGNGPQTPHTPNPSVNFPAPSPNPVSSQNSTSSQNQNNNSAGVDKRFPGPSPQNSGQNQNQNQGPRTPVSGLDNSMPRTPGVMDMMSGSRYPGSSPQMPGGPASVGTPGFSSQSSGPMLTSQGPASYPGGPGSTGPGPLKMPTSPFPELSSPRMNSIEMGHCQGFSTGPGENMPLNPIGTPNSMGPSPAGNQANKMAGFDPITSMAQMSQQLTNTVGPGPSLSSSPNPGMMSGPMGPNAGPMNPGNPVMGPMGPMVNFSNSMHTMQGMQPMGDPVMMSGPGGPGPQGVGNSFVNNPMNMQQMGMHGGSYNPMMGQMMNMDPNKGMPHGSIGMGGPPRGPQMQPMMQGSGPGGPMGPGNMMGGVQRMMSGPAGPGPMGRTPGPAPGPGPFNGANVQVKASAPNTIQYLPARPQTTAPSPRGPPSLDFLQRFTGPMSNMDGKTNPNMPFFSNNPQGSGGPNNTMGGIPMNMAGVNGPMGPGNGMGGPMGGPMGNMNMGMSGQMGPMNGPMVGPGGNNPMMNQMGAPMSMNGPMVGPGGGGGVMSPNPNMGGMNGPNGGNMGMGPSMPMMGMSNVQMGPQGMGMAGMRPAGPGGMMRPQQMSSMYGGPSGPGNPMNNEPMFMSGPGPGPNPNMGPMGCNMSSGGPGNPMMMAGGPNPNMYNPQNKGSPMGPGPNSNGDQVGGMAGQNQGSAGGQGFKNSPYLGPTTADPNYAQQFHNFQQQLYATNTRSQMSNQTMGAANQSFFGPK